MDSFFKTGALFVTLTPTDIRRLTTSFLAGRMTAKSIRKVKENELPIQAQRIGVSGIDPVACTEYFEWVYEAFLNTLWRSIQIRDFHIQGDCLNM